MVPALEGEMEDGSKLFVYTRQKKEVRARGSERPYRALTAALALGFVDVAFVSIMRSVECWVSASAMAL